MARAKGIDIAPKYIPAEVFDKRAVEKNQVVFHDVSYIEVKRYRTLDLRRLSKHATPKELLELQNLRRRLESISHGSDPTALDLRLANLRHHLATS